MKRTNREFYGKLGVKNLCSEVKTIWYSRDDELPDLPSYQMSYEFESDVDWYEKKDFVRKVFDIGVLTERELLVVRLIVIEGQTLEETGTEIGVTGDRTRQILAKSLRRLRRKAAKLLGVTNLYETHYYQERQQTIPQRLQRWF